MKIILSILVLLLTLLGCQEQSAHTGDVAMDFIIDTSNGLIHDTWADDEQKRKYSPLARLSSDSCRETMSRAFEKLMDNREALKLLSTDEQAAMEKVRRSSPSERDAMKRILGNRLCGVLSILARRS